uniref:Uncharacterized protein n=1 Tax=Spongospora subterranea TaxID=70186 RepID=A0A0H5R772_9EUKA|eukprot:CRZ09990.1 hypothetical protein [Spongospora subterranea]
MFAMLIGIGTISRQIFETILSLQQWYIQPYIPASTDYEASSSLGDLDAEMEALNAEMHVLLGYGDNLYSPEEVCLGKQVPRKYARFTGNFINKRWMTKSVNNVH